MNSAPWEKEKHFSWYSCLAWLQTTTSHISFKFSVLYSKFRYIATTQAWMIRIGLKLRTLNPLAKGSSWRLNCPTAIPETICYLWKNFWPGCRRSWGKLIIYLIIYIMGDCDVAKLSNCIPSNNETIKFRLSRQQKRVLHLFIGFFFTRRVPYHLPFNLHNEDLICYLISRKGSPSYTGWKKVKEKFVTEYWHAIIITYIASNYR